MADTHIQNTAPAPPEASAAATPAIFPVPSVAASAEDIAWNGVTPSALRSRRTPENTVRRSHSLGRRSCMNPVRAEKYAPDISMSAIIGAPHSTPFTCSVMPEIIPMQSPPLLFLNLYGGWDKVIRNLIHNFLR